jgi:hypothetical protein
MDISDEWVQAPKISKKRERAISFSDHESPVADYIFLGISLLVLCFLQWTSQRMKTMPRFERACSQPIASTFSRNGLTLVWWQTCPLRLPPQVVIASCQDGTSSKKVGKQRKQQNPCMTTFAPKPAFGTAFFHQK